ncbi:MAG: hypothetical protein RSC60_03045, partial [Christensenellaceae bacterium]
MADETEMKRVKFGCEYEGTKADEIEINELVGKCMDSFGGLRVDRTEMKTISEKLRFIKEKC